MDLTGHIEALSASIQVASLFRRALIKQSFASSIGVHPELEGRLDKSQTSRSSLTSAPYTLLESNDLPQLRAVGVGHNTLVIPTSASIASAQSDHCTPYDLLNCNQSNVRARRSITTSTKIRSLIKDELHCECGFNTVLRDESIEFLPAPIRKFHEPHSLHGRSSSSKPRHTAPRHECVCHLKHLSILLKANGLDITISQKPPRSTTARTTQSSRRQYALRTGLAS